MEFLWTLLFIIIAVVVALKVRKQGWKATWEDVTGFLVAAGAAVAAAWEKLT